MGQDPGHGLGWPLIYVDVTIKITIINIVLKLDSKIDLGQSPGHRSS